MTDTKESLSKLTKLAYGAGDTGFSMCHTIISLLYGIFLVDVAGLTPELAAGVLFAVRSWDYINDPLIGYLSDRMRSRWGRRRPFLLFGFIPFMIAFILLWWRPPVESLSLLALYYGAAYLFFETASTFTYMPYFALTPELTQDYDERTSLTSYRMVFSILGGLVAFIIPLSIIGEMHPDNKDRVMLMAAIFGIAGGLPLLLTFLGTRERSEYAAREQPRLLDSVKAAFKNRPFLFAAGIFLFTWLAIDIIESMLLFFLKYRLDMESQSDLISGVIFITAMISLFFWTWTSKRWDKRYAYIAGMVFLASAVLFLIFMDPGWGLSLVIVLAVVAGIGVGAAHVLPWAIIPDAVEWDEYETGCRHEGMFYSLVTLMRKISGSLAIPAALLVLGRSGYIANAAVQDPGAVRAIQIMMGPVPTVLLLVGILFALVYPLGRDLHNEMRKELEARRSAINYS